MNEEIGIGQGFQQAQQRLQRQSGAAGSRNALYMISQLLTKVAQQPVLFNRFRQIMNASKDVATAQDAIAKLTTAVQTPQQKQQMQATKQQLTKQSLGQTESVSQKRMRYLIDT